MAQSSPAAYDCFMHIIEHDNEIMVQYWVLDHSIMVVF